MAAKMNSWIEQIGYPLITVERDYDAQTITFTQAKYNPFCQNYFKVTCGMCPSPCQLKLILSLQCTPISGWIRSLLVRKLVHSRTRHSDIVPLKLWLLRASLQLISGFLSTLERQLSREFFMISRTWTTCWDNSWMTTWSVALASSYSDNLAWKMSCCTIGHRCWE